MPVDPRVHSAQGRLANACRRKDRTPESVAAARTALNEAKVQAWVEQTLATAPPNLSPETEARLARLLTGADQ
jgi:hypothetical protein